MNAEIERDSYRAQMIEAAREGGRLEAELRAARSAAEHREWLIGRLIAAANTASATLSHAYNTVLEGQLAEDAQLAFEELDRAISLLRVDRPVGLGPPAATRQEFPKSGACERCGRCREGNFAACKYPLQEV